MILWMRDGSPERGRGMRRILAAALTLFASAGPDALANPASPYENLVESEPALYFELPAHLASRGRALDDAPGADPFAPLLQRNHGGGSGLVTGGAGLPQSGYAVAPDERSALLRELERQVTGGAPAAVAGLNPGVPPGGERDVHNFYAEAMRVGQRALDFSFSLGRSSPSPAAVDPQRAAARAEMEAVGQELLRPALQLRMLLQDATQELRRFILMQEPMTAQMMMVDGRSGHGLVMAVNAPQEAAAGKQKNERVPGSGIGSPRGPVENALAAPRHRMEETEERPPLGILLWRILTDRLSFVIYGILALCWAAWRYVISRYA